MKAKEAKVSYRHSETKEMVDLGTIQIDEPETVDEAVTLYGGEKDLLDLAHTAYVIDQQATYRNNNRTDKPKSSSAVSKFRQLSPEKQEELLRAAGML
jgi:hypothetical protein